MPLPYYITPLAYAADAAIDFFRHYADYAADD